MRSLLPFAKTPLSASISVHAELFQTSPENILVEFLISGALQNIAWPPPQVIEARADELWKQTCLEVFISHGLSAQDPYLEVNCSPNGNWNAYSFSSYRQGMTPAADITVRLKERSSQSNEARFRLEIASTQALHVAHLGLTAAIEFTSGEKSYFALKHPAAQADFHDKNGWE
ncbi:MAG: DOMON-like domain-containing protein [Bdellovibrio sp.]|nr:DOMON-like domain-containing protein [Bdellovibrio sp.]